MKLYELHTQGLVSLSEEEDGKSVKDTKRKVRDDEISKIKRAYVNSGETQQDIAQKAGLHPSTVSRYKSKKDDVHRDPSVDSLRKIVKATGASAGDIVPGL